MRLKEWFSWHFPELAKIASDNAVYSRLIQFIKTRDGACEENREMLQSITLDEGKTEEIIEAAKTSMGQDISDIDRDQIQEFTERTVELIAYRVKVGIYLTNRMNAVAPNLATLIGENVGAKLISHAGSLVNLAKYPASTIQILGAEKALFRALKTKGKTPKYGLIYNSTFIGRAGAKNKGRISRYLANKCAIAARVDQFSILVSVFLIMVQPTNKFGDSLRSQVEERLTFFSSGAKPKKNKDVMQEVLDELKAEGLYTTMEKDSDAEVDEQPKKKPEKSG